ncbi:MAG TPA: DUF167 domain-containing protein [Candidatus Obscuribacterales bacterium]
MKTLALLKIKVKPNSKQQAFHEEPDGSLTVHLKSPPVEGKANQELIKFLAQHLGVPKSQIIIKSGLSSRHKFVEVPDPNS